MALAAVAVLGMCGSADAFDIDTGSEDLILKWDTTFRYTLAGRLKDQSDNIMSSVNHSDGDSNFGKGIVSSRLDVLTEADLVYKKSYGARLSAAGWYDPLLYSKTNKYNQFPNHLGPAGNPTPGFNNETKDQFGGVDGEVLDALVFAKFDVGDTAVGVRAGRHTIYWGEAFFPAANSNGISYGQSPLDMAKALAMPGVDLKEIFRPLNQISTTIQPTKDIVIAAQYYLEWEQNKFPESGSYLGMLDGFMKGGESFYLPWGLAPNAGDHTPKNSGDWGVKVGYTPDWLNGTIGLHYRNFSDKMPQVLGANFFTPPGAPPFITLPTKYYLDYKSDIELYGISFAKNIMGISVGSELSYRKNMPLTSQWFTPEGARGDTMHAVLNFLSVLPKTALFDTGTAILEFSYGRWDKVTSGAQYFTGNKNGLNIGGGPTNAGVDAATKDNSVVTLNVVPEWKQVMPGIDLAMPLNFSAGMHGNAATLTGGTKGTGSYSAGLSFDVFAKYKVDLTYASFFGGVHPDASGQINPPGLAAPGQGASDAIALLRDRDMLSLTIKASF